MHSTPLVVKDTIVIGSSMKEGMTVVTRQQHQGLSRAPSTRGPARRSGSSTRFRAPASSATTRWENEFLGDNGNVGVWTQITADEDAGLVYLPVETPTSDYLRRPSARQQPVRREPRRRRSEDRRPQVALPVRPSSDLEFRHTRRRRSSPTSRSTANPSRPSPSPEQARMALRVRSHHGAARLAHRGEAGSAVRRARRKDVADAAASRPSLPAYARNSLLPGHLIDFTPEHESAGARTAEALSLGTVAVRSRGARECERTPWRHRCRARPRTGRARRYDPETHTVYAQASNNGFSARSLAPMPAGFLTFDTARAWRDVRSARRSAQASARRLIHRLPVDVDAARRNRQPAPAPAPAGGAAPAAAPEGGGGLNIQGLPIVKPPYGVVTAVNLDRGEIMWQVPHGDTPDAIRNHPLLRGMNIGKTGQNGTRRLHGHQDARDFGRRPGHLPPGRPRGAMLHAYDKKTRTAGRRSLDAGAAKRFADDLRRRRQARSSSSP